MRGGGLWVGEDERALLSDFEERECLWVPRVDALLFGASPNTAMLVCKKKKRVLALGTRLRQAARLIKEGKCADWMKEPGSRAVYMQLRPTEVLWVVMTPGQSAHSPLCVCVCLSVMHRTAKSCV